MTQRLRTRWLAAGAALLVSATGVTADRGFADAVLGGWDITVQHPDGPYPSWVEIRLRTESELMARFVGRFGSVRYLSSISYRDGLIEFTAPAQYEDHDLRFVGSLGDGGISGKTFDANGKAIPFTARRAPGLIRTAGSSAADTIALFDGRTLDGWRLRHDRHADCWQVVDGLLTAMPPCVDLVTMNDFDDFRLEVEFRYPEGSNSGIYLRGRYEIQIQDDHGKALDPLRMGSVYGFIAPAAGAAKPAGAWQSAVITLIGRKVTVVLNDQTVIDGQRIPGITGGALDSNEAGAGPIMLQGDHGPIEFRRVELTPL
jgi:hypothetical protein